MKKQIFRFLLFLLVAVFLSLSALAAEISTAEELAALMQDSSKWSESFVLTSDIDMSDAEQSPIGSYEVPFSGTFDGNGHTVKGLSIRADFTAGLFGVLENATVKNLTVEGKITNDFIAENAETKDEDGRYPGTGALAAIILGGVTVENCHATATVTAPGNVGGLIGNVHNFSENPVNIINCSSNCQINSLLGNAGGTIGRIFISCPAENAVLVSGCTNLADLTLTSEDRCRVGGIVGYMRTLDGVISIVDCRNEGDITGSNSGEKASNYPYAGGIVGRCEVATGASAAIRISDCVNKGDISSTQCAGGITAYMSRADVCAEVASTVTGCLNAGKVDGYLCGAGILGYSENKCIADTHSAVVNCLNIAPISSVSNAGGIIARHYGFDIVNCANLATVTSAIAAGGLSGQGVGETVAVIKDSYYLDTSAVVIALPIASITETGNSAVTEDDIAKQEKFGALDFSALWTIGKNGLALSKFASETYVEEIPEQTEPPVTEEEPSITVLPDDTEAADTVEPEADGGANYILLAVLIAVAAVAIAASVIFAMRKNKSLLIAAVCMLALAALMLIVGLVNGWFTAEHNESGDTDLPGYTYDPSSDTPNLPDPATVDIAGDFHFLVAGNWTWNDFDSDGTGGTVVDTAIFRRNENIRQKYGVNITNEDIVRYSSSMGAGDGYRKIYTDYMAGDSNYDATMVGTYDVATLAYNGYLQDLNSIKYLDLSKPYWDQKANKDLSMKGKMYYTTGDISLSDNRSTYTLFFSKNMVDLYGLPDPYQLVRDGEWTIEAFGQMVKSVGSDDNMDGVYDKNDTFGLLTPTDTHLAILSAAGEKIGTINEEGQIELTFYNERVDNLYDKYLDIVGDHAHTYNYQYNYQTGATGLQSTNEERIGMFNTNKALFYSHTMFYMDELRDIESDFGIIPYPKYDEAQANYGNLVSPWHSQFLCVPALNTGLDRIGIVLEELAYEGKQLMTPAYYEVTLVGQYTRDEESAEMLDIIFANLVFDVGAYYNIGTYKDQLGGIVRSGNSLSTIYETYRPQAESKLEDINAFFAKSN